MNAYKWKTQFPDLKSLIFCSDKNIQVFVLMKQTMQHIISRLSRVRPPIPIYNMNKYKRTHCIEWTYTEDLYYTFLIM